MAGLQRVTSLELELHCLIQGYRTDSFDVCVVVSYFNTRHTYILSTHYYRKKKQVKSKLKIVENLNFKSTDYTNTIHMGTSLTVSIIKYWN